MKIISNLFLSLLVYVTSKGEEKDSCKISGCFDTICSTNITKPNKCLNKKEDKCYKTAVCSKKNNICTWEKSSTLLKCLNDLKNTKDINLRKPVTDTKFLTFKDKGNRLPVEPKPIA